MKNVQAVLAVVSVALGVTAFALVIMVDSWQREQIRDLAAKFAPDVLVVRRTAVLPPDLVVEPGGGIGLTLEEAESFRSVDGVAEIGFQASGFSARVGPASIYRVPISEELFSVLGLELSVGQELTEQHRRLDLPVAVLGATTAAELFGTADAAVGQMLAVAGQQEVRVVGVLEPVPSGVDELQYLNATILVPYSPSNTFVFFGRPPFSTVFVRHEPGQGAEAAVKLAEMLSGLPVGRAYEVVRSDEWLASQQLFRDQVADQLVLGSGWIVVLALMATLGNFMNSLGLRAADRSKMTALKRAVGAARLKVALETLSDGLQVGIAGTVAGLGLWFVINRLVVSNYLSVPATWEAVLVSSAAGVLISLLASVPAVIWMLRMPIYKALREELTPPVWSGFALTGVTAGVLALVVSSSIQEGTDHWFRQQLLEVGADRIVVTTRGAGPADRRTSTLATPPFDEIDVRNVENIPGVANVAAVMLDSIMALVLDANSTPPQIEPVTVSIVDPTYFSVHPRPLTAGRLPEATDEVLFSEQMAVRVFGADPASAVGRPVVIASNRGRLGEPVTYTIAGILEHRDWRSPGDLGPLAIVRLRSEADSTMTAIPTRDLHIQLDLSVDTTETVEEIRAMMLARHPEYSTLSIHEPVADVALVRAAMTEVGGAWRLMAWISFAIGGFGLASIITVFLTNNRTEFALRRAIGASRADVVRISVTYAVRTALLASVLGLVFAALLLVWVTALAPWQYSWPWMQSAIALLVALTVALLATVGPTMAFSSEQPWAILRE